MKTKFMLPSLLVGLRVELVFPRLHDKAIWIFAAHLEFPRASFELPGAPSGLLGRQLLNENTGIK